MTDQPTPPSSLEEARQFMRDWLADCGLRYVEQDSLYGVDAALAQFEAAAREEVIREVEAALESWAQRHLGEQSPALAELNEAMVRALSQGGEGKGQ